MSYKFYQIKNDLTILGLIWLNIIVLWKKFMSQFISKKAKKLGLCGLCGKEAALTTDHIPPRAIFLPPFPANLITINACASCNNGTSKNDEHFAVLLALLIGHNSYFPPPYFLNMMSRLKEKNKKAYKRIQSNISSMSAFTRAGIYLGKRNAYTMDSEDNRVYDESIKKMARGLYYYHFGKVLAADDNLCFKVKFFYEINQNILTALADCHYGSKGEFAYLYSSTEVEGCTVWLFQFYEKHWSVCYTYPKHLSKNFESRIFSPYHF